MGKIIKKFLFSVLALFSVAVCVWLFPFVASKSTTFAQVLQDKEKTLEKYKSIWNSTKIVEIDAKAPQYKLGDRIGTLTIPKMDLYEMPIYYGEDTINNNWQITAPGKYGNWGIFGEKAVTALGGHNYQLFSELPYLEEGDKFIVELDYDTYVYEVTGNVIYDATKDNFSDMTFNGKEPYSVDLLTCYPIDKVVTDDMYIVYSKMVKGTKFLKETPALTEKELEMLETNK